MIKRFFNLIKRRVINKKAFRRLFIVMVAISFILSIFLSYAYFFNVDRFTVIKKIPPLVRRPAYAIITYGFKEIKNYILDIPYFLYSFKVADTDDISIYNLIIDDDKLKKLSNNIPKDCEGHLTKEYKETVSAKFLYKDKQYDVKVRYRGDLKNHWCFEKKSWQIEFTGDYFENKKSIGLIIPRDRFFFVEHFNNYRAKKLGLIIPESKFSILKINGKNYGLYFEVEDWGEEFLEKAGLNPDANFYGEKDIGNIFDSASEWKKYTRDAEHAYKHSTEMEKLLNLLKNSDDSTFYKKIVDLIDMDNFYKWNIHSTLSGSLHQSDSHNIRLYFDNTIGKFKFIPWDVGLSKMDEAAGVIHMSLGIDYINYNPVVARILKNPEFLQKRNNLLFDYIDNKDNRKEDLEFYNKLYNKHRIVFYQDKTKRYANNFFDKKVAEYRSLIEFNFEYIKELFKNSEFREKIYFNNGYNSENDISIQIDLLLKSYSPVFLKDIELKTDEEINSDFLIFYDSDFNDEFSRSDILLGNLIYDKKDEKYKFNLINKERLFHTNRTWISKPEYRAGVLKEIESDELEETLHRIFLVPENNKIFIKNASVKVILENHYTKKKIKSSKTEYIDANEFAYFNEKSATKEEFLIDNPIFKNGFENKVILPGGSYVISKNIIIPKDLEVLIVPGAQLYFSKDASLISYSPVIANGARFLALNRSEPWGVFGIVEASKKSEFKNSVFEYGGQAYVNGAFFSGMLALHSSDADIKNCQFKYATGDDGLNVKNAYAEISSSLFYKNNFDALDFDFIEGKILNNTFQENGNDGIDISGSDLLIKGNNITESWDKCLSIGEKSKGTVSENRIEGCNIGIAVKDLSEPIIIDNIIFNNKFGISAYQKKPIFGGGFPRVGNNTFNDNEKDIELDNLSKIIKYD